MISNLLVMRCTTATHPHFIDKNVSIPIFENGLENLSNSHARFVGSKKLLLKDCLYFFASYLWLFGFEEDGDQR